MPITKTILPEFDHEMATTRRVLERIVDDKFDWRPHEKSMTLGELATHLSSIPSWTAMTFAQDNLDIAPPGAPEYREDAKTSRADVLEAFDKNVASARAALESATDDNWQGKWSLLNRAKPIFTLPRTAVMRGFILSHSIHHRAQLAVYLRLLDIPVPSIYGPSADEGSF